MKKLVATAVVLIFCVACAKKTATNSASGTEPKSGTMTTSNSNPSTNSVQPKDLAGTWIVKQGGDTWELVVTRTGPGTYSGSSTLVATDDPSGLYGPPGSKGDDIVILSDEPGKFRVRWAKAENFHRADFWEGTGTYDDNSFDFAGAYKGKRKA